MPGGPSGGTRNVGGDRHHLGTPRAGVVGYADFSGGSGHGFKIAPAIGRELADWLLTGKGADDFRQFSHDRIAAGNLFVQSFGGNRG